MGQQPDRSAAAPAVGRLRAAKADFDGLVVVCAKCAKRQGLSKRVFGRSLKRAFKRETQGLKVRVVETGCFGPCPKRAIAVATPVSIGRRRVMLLDPALPRTAIRGLLPDLGLEAMPAAEVAAEGDARP